MLRELWTSLVFADVRPVVAGAGMSVFGLNCPGGCKLSHATSDAVAGAIAFDRLEGAPDAPTLAARNASGRPVLLMAGEILVGGPHSYLLNQSVLLGVGGRVVLPVSLIESVGERIAPGPVRHAGCLAHGRLRERVHKDIHESYRLAAAPVSYRSNVRAEVDRMRRALGCRSLSASLCRAYQEFAEYVEEMLGGIPAPKDCRGVVVVSGSRLRGIDLFDSPETLAHYWDGLLRSFGLDAVLEDPPADAPALDGPGIRGLLATLGDAEVSSYASPGLGDDLRFRTAGLFGAALVLEGSVVHAELFATD